MVYCPKCGTNNEEGAQFCNKCGASLTSAKREYDKECEDRCEEECHAGPRRPSLFWGVILFLIGLWIVFEFGLKNIQGMPTWISNFNFGWVIPVIIGLAIISVAIRMITKRD